MYVLGYNRGSMLNVTKIHNEKAEATLAVPVPAPHSTKISSGIMPKNNSREQ